MSPLDPLDRLGESPPPPDPTARRQALDAADAAFVREATQGSRWWRRLIDGTASFRRSTMTSLSLSRPALASLLIVPVVGVFAWMASDGVLSPQRPAAPDTAAGRVTADDTRSDAAEPEPSPEQAAAEEPAAATSKAPLPVARKTEETYLPAPASPAVEALLPELALIPARPSRDRFASPPDNPVRLVAEAPVSTFSLDVDTASYGIVRRSLREGRLPEPDAVRVEELVNYFPYEWPVPDNPQTPFKPSVTLVPSPWTPGRLLMHVAIKGYDLPAAERPRANLVFLVDTSGSMEGPDRLPLVKASLKLLLDRLSPDDTVGLVAYAGQAGVVLDPTPASQRAAIAAAIDRLGAGGSTAGAAGLEEAYRLAEAHFIEGGVNRVMIATDGDFNVGPSDDDSLKRLIEQRRESGVFLSVLGFGMGNLNDGLMQVLAQNGNGVAAHIDTAAEAEKTLVQEASAALYPIARDVKVQVEFNPARVAEYRLIGYETRALSRQDFDDDRVDAGEVGAGQSVTAIYELTPAGSPDRAVRPLRYGTTEPARPVPTEPAATSHELANLAIRYKRPEGGDSVLIERTVSDDDRLASLATASDDVRFSIAVAGFGQALRRGPGAAFDWDAIEKLAGGARGSDPFGYRAEFLGLVRLAKGLDAR